MTIFLALIVLLSCFIIPGANGQQLAIQKEVAGTILCCGLIVWWIWKSNKWLALLIGWCLVRLFLPPEQVRGALTMLNIIMAGIVYLSIIHMRIDVKGVLKAIAVVCCVHYGVIFLQSVNLFPFWNNNAIQSSGRVWGLMGNSNFTGCFIAISLPVFLELGFKERRAWFLGLIGGLISLFVMGATFPIIAGISGVLFYIYILYRDEILENSLLWAIIAVLFIGIIHIIRHPVIFDVTDLERFETWRRIWAFMTFNTGADWQSHFTQGWGLGSSYGILPKIGYSSSDQVYFQAHNELLQTLLELGIIGVGISLTLIITTFMKTTRNVLVFISCLFAVLVNSMGFFVFHMAPMGYMAVIYLALIDKNGGENATVL